MSMGVDHGGGTNPPEFGVADANANSPPDFVIGTKRVLWLSNTPKSVFGGGSAPDPAVAAQDALPDP